MSVQDLAPNVLGLTLNVRSDPRKADREMRHALAHQITGYDRITERVAITIPVPDSAIDAATAVARVDPSEDPGALYSYRLEGHQLRELRGFLSRDLSLEPHDFFLEPVAGALTE